MKRKNFKFTLLAKATGRRALLGISVMLAAMTLTSCTSSDDNPVDTTPTAPTEQDIFANMEKISAPAYISDVTNAYLKEAIDRRFTNQTSLDNAQIAVVTPQEIGTYDGKLKELYDNGGLIVILKPNAERYKAFVEKYGLQYTLPSVDDNEMLLFAFNNKQEYYTSFMPEENSYQMISKSYDEETDTWGESVESTESASNTKDAAFYVEHTNLFAKWISKRYGENASRTRADFKEQIDLDAQTFYGDKSWSFSCRNTYETEFNRTIKGTKKISYVFSVSPIYIFEDNGSSKKGDYYKVESTITCHNAEGYTPTWFNKDNGADDYIVGFYMKGLYADFAYGKNQNKMKVLFLQGGEPMPQSTNMSTTFSDSKSFTLTGSLSKGWVGPNPQRTRTAGFSASMSQSISQTLNDVETTMSSSDGLVSYHYFTHGPEGKDAVLRIGKTDKGEHWKEWLEGDFSGTDANVPALLRTDMVLNASWIWYDNTTSDNSTDKRQLYMSLKPVYGAWYYSHGLPYKAVENEYNPSAYTLWQDLTAPDREPFGLLELSNNSSYSLGNIKVWRQSDNPEKATPYLDLDGQSYRSNENCCQALPVGTYRVQYDFIDGNTNTVISKWEIQNIVIKHGSTSDSSKTRYSSTAGKQI